MNEEIYTLVNPKTGSHYDTYEAKLQRGDKITIEFDDEDGDYKAGEYTIIGGKKGGKELEGMGIKIFMTDRELNSIEYTVVESVNEMDDNDPEKFEDYIITDNLN